MLSPQDERWLKKVLCDCFKSLDIKITKEQKLLGGFSLLIREMVKNMERVINETWALWELEPASKEIKEKLHSLEKCLSYLKKYCQEKIEGKHK